MIYIKETQLPTSRIIPRSEQIIGVVNNNNADTRTFVLPRHFKGLDLTDDNYKLYLQIQPVGKNELPYNVPLDDVLVDDEIYLEWKITRRHTKNDGKLPVSILVLNEADDIVWQSFMYEFFVEKGINTIGANETVVGERLAVEVNDNGRLQRAMDTAAGGTLRIPNGVYYINPAENDGRGVDVHSNTNIIMEQGAILRALATDAEKYSVLDIYNAKDIYITGGVILGERYDHTGTTGEHGMGININSSENITIDGMIIRNCWGDSIYVGDYGMGGEYCRNIAIRNCILDGSRRQGISFTLCDGAAVENCMLMNIKGTNPQCGIDIETNSASKPCKNITVDKCYFTGSAGGGLSIYTMAEDIEIINCTFESNRIHVENTVGIKVANCTLYGSNVTFRNCADIVREDNVYENSVVDVVVG